MQPVTTLEPSLLEAVSGSGPPVSGAGEWGKQKEFRVVESQRGGGLLKMSDSPWHCLCMYACASMSVMVGVLCAHGAMPEDCRMACKHPNTRLAEQRINWAAQLSS